MLQVKGKKLLVLGGTVLSCEIIKQAKKIGIYVIVTDYLEDSPGKKIADKSFMISTTDVDAVVKLIKTEGIDGVITGFTDSLLLFYQQICEKAGMYCYINKEQIEVVTNKIKFKQLCREHLIPVVKECKIHNPMTPKDLDRIKFPVVVKPVDNSGARGVNICKNAEELLLNYQKALTFSKSRQVIVEDYMPEEEVTIFYIAQNGKIHLLAMADKYTNHKQNQIIALPFAYIFPSKHLKTYMAALDEKVKEMYESIGIKNGIIFIQSFVKNGDCIFYEMGFRLTASMEYKIIEKISKINSMDMMINYAFTGKMNESDIKNYVNPDFKIWGSNITFIAEPGVIASIVGVNEVSLLPEVLDVFLYYNEGDEIPVTALGTNMQLAIRVFVVVETKDALAAIIDKILNIIEIHSNKGENMILKRFDSSRIY